ncbi:MAG TPA: hypothetical protein VIM61_14235 [Chthoniobacterales bacterium]
MKSSRLAACLFLFLGGFLVSWIYQTPPSLGDDLNYWGLAFDLHHGVSGAWSKTSFHDLRWPVWGLCWLLQIPFGFSALSYYLEPMVYLGAGAVVVFLIARALGTTDRVALAAGILFLFHPQLDSVVDRPMPDLSEGFWVAVAFLAWLHMVRNSRPVAKAGLAATIGLALAVGQANRITGVFAIPVLLLATLAFYPRQILWLALSGAFAAGFVFVEAAVYHALTGDWLHSLHANATATGRKGTEPIPFWELPVRFLPTLFRRPTDIVFNSVAILGIGLAWRNYRAPGRALVVYALGYVLTYSCAVQSLFPLRPLVRDGDRFLGSLAFPLAILTAIALAQLVAWLQPRLPRLLAKPRRATVVAAFALLILALTFLSSRPFRGLNYLHEIAAYLRTVPAGTRVLSHDAMRHVANLADPTAAGRVKWTLQKDLLDPSPTTLQLASEADEIWFNRKWIWTGTRKKSEYDKLDALGDIAPWLRPPLAGWTARRAILKGDVPDFVFLARAASDTRPPAEQSPDGRLLRTELLPDFPVPHTWSFTKPPRDVIELPVNPLPAWLRGRTLFLSLRFSSNTTEPVRAGVTFLHGDTVLQQLTFKPYFFDESSEDFFFLTVPPEADTMQIRLRISSKARRITLERFRLFADSPEERAQQKD